MIEPNISPVAPRVYSPESGAVLQLADEVELLLERDRPVKVRLDGEGNLAALSHLAEIMADQVANGRLRLEGKTLPLDSGDPVVTLCADPSFQFLFPASKKIYEGNFDLILHVARWQRDDCIEYLLAKNPEQCASVMSRLQHADLGFADGSPVLWQVILDRMAGDEDKTDLEKIVLDEIDLRINNPSLANAIADRLIFPTQPDLVGVLGHPTIRPDVDDSILFNASQSAAADFLSHKTVKFAFAIRRCAQRMRDGNLKEINLLLRYPLRTPALVRLAAEISGDEETYGKLQLLFAHNSPWIVSNSATLLALSDYRWRPRGEGLQLNNAYFPEVNWPDITFVDAHLRKTTFMAAELSGSIFRDCQLSMANFSEANLSHADFHCPQNITVELTGHSGASRGSSRTRAKKEIVGRKSAGRFEKMRERLRQFRRKNKKVSVPVESSSRSKLDLKLEEFRFHRMNFQGCNLTKANLSGCLFSEVDFSDANLADVVARQSAYIRANLQDVTLTGGDFAHAAFYGVDMRSVAIDRCVFVYAAFKKVNFEGLVANDVEFSFADFGGSVWTDSVLTQCQFRASDLQGNRLADIRWEDCDLRGSDLRGCTFHMGSSRSGIVDSPYPSHGTRTGFYTDDYNDQHFRPPETIRKASLQGCDLRGAIIHGVDFYLVDLRDAKFDESQREQLISTGAILDDFCP